MTSFVKLFIMNRMIKLNNNCRDTSVLFPVEHMMMKDKNTPRIKAAEKAQDIITRLSMIGIKKYMDKQYDENESELISVLFDKLVGKYPNEHATAASFPQYKDSNENNDQNQDTDCDEFKLQLQEETKCYAKKFFCQADLMPQVFQYLQSSCLSHCCLVNSIWCYHAFDINSIYHVTMNGIYRISYAKTRHQHEITSQHPWNQLVNAKHFDLKITKLCNQRTIDEHFVNGFNKLRKIESVNVRIDWYDNSMYRSYHDFLVVVCKNGSENKYKSFSYSWKDRVYKYRDNYEECKPPSFTSDQCEKISLTNIAIPIVFTNKCTTLMLSDITMRYQWCKDIIDTCDLSGVTYLKLNVFFRYPQDISHHEYEQCMKEMILKFVNLKYLYIIEHETSAFFWKELKPILNKNNVIVNVDLDESVESHFDNFIIDNGLRFNQLTVRTSSMNPNFYPDVLNFMSNSKIQSMIEKLKFPMFHVYAHPTIVPYLSSKILKNDLRSNFENKFTSLMIVTWEFDYSERHYDILSVYDIGQFFEMVDMLSQNGCFIKVNVVCYHIMELNEQLSQLFDILFKMIEKSIPLDIKIKFRQQASIDSSQSNEEYILEKLAKNSFTTCDKLFKSSFKYQQSTALEFLKNNNPSCNKYCKNISDPQCKFEFGRNGTNFLPYNTYAWNTEHIIFATLKIQTARQIKDIFDMYA